jgi:dolichol-phosphate mannosyltransferase
MDSNDKILVIIPTYNEVGNVKKVIPQVLAQHSRIEVLVVDDNSPDGTADAVKRMMKKEGRVHLLERPAKMGLGTAYVAGFRFALQADYEFIFEMDADLSHDPKVIDHFLNSIQENDLVIGSRYIQGVNVVNWPLSRLLLSWFANLYTRLITRMPIKDATSGFKCFKRKVLETINLNEIHSDGYAFQIEMHYKAWKKGFRLKEIPIVFLERDIGVSKMSPGIIREAAWIVWKLRFLSLAGKL